MKILKIAVSAGIFALVIAGAIYFMTVSEPKQNWVISGGEEGGKYDEVARALGVAMVDKFDPDVRVEISSGSRQNVERLQNGEADLCLVQNDVAGEKGIRSIATLYKEVLHVIVREGPKVSRLQLLSRRDLRRMESLYEKKGWRRDYKPFGKAKQMPFAL